MGLIGASSDDAPRSLNRREHGVWTRLLSPGEQVQEAMTGRRVDYTTIPYRSVTHFAVEASGVFAADADLGIWVAGRTAPFEKSFGSDVDVYAVQAALAHHVGG